MEELDDPNDVEFCKECGNNIHKECLKNWKIGCRNQGNPVTCVYCRAEWPEEVRKGKKGSRSEGYSNFASEAGMSGRRDTSTYSEWYEYHRQGYGNRRRRWY